MPLQRPIANAALNAGATPIGNATPITNAFRAPP